MKSYKISLFAVVSILLVSNSVSFGAPNKGQPFRNSQSNQAQQKRLSAGCAIAKAQSDLDINNVRARIFSCGDMWWDLSNTAKYEVPKVTQAGQVSICSMFAGSLWIGGTENGNLKIAAMTYRQSGVDFYPGPLDTTTANVASTSTCAAYDRLFEVTRAEINNFIADPTTGITNDIQNWPGNGIASRQGLDGNIAANLAPYVDVDHNMVYNPATGGDYPDVYGDQVLWYVYNDVGNAHGETKGQSIGLECQEEAFEFATNDEINNMTFYKTIVINRSSNTLKNTWFGQWCDPDLGYAFDDYVGCDTTRQLGYDYNGEDFDPGLTGYGNNPPCVGAAFFHGPVGDNGQVLGMSRFLYYNNNASAINGNPGFPNPDAQDYYNYLQGFWKNGAHMKYGADGVSGTTNTNYMFPGDPTQSGAGGGWTEKSAGDQFGDRRFLESSGPFTLQPGARNVVTVAVVWARTNAGGATGSIGSVKLATDLAKVTYNNNFKILNGADAPNVVIRGMDQKLVIILQNTNTSNVEKYEQKWVDQNNNTMDYKFQGYLVYQLANSSVSQADYNNINSARLIAQCDLKDSITGAIANYDTLPGVIGKVNIIQLAAQANAGLSHTFEVTTDAFNSNIPLVNDKPYYFSVISYSTLRPKLLANYEANFVGSKHNVQVIQAIPHKNDAEFGGTQLHADYATGPEITRIEGNGNGGNILEFTQSTIDTILQQGHILHPTYQGGHGPVNIKVYDPTILTPGNYVMRFTDSTIKTKPANNIILSEVAATTGTIAPVFVNSANWVIQNLTASQTVKSENSIIVPDEQILSVKGGGDSTYYWGMSATILQPFGPGNSNLNLVQDPGNGFLQATLTYEDSTNKWLSGVASIPAEATLTGQKVPTPGNWIRSGAGVSGANWTKQDGNAALSLVNPAYPKYSSQSDTLVAVDPFGAYSKLLGATIAPACLVAEDGQGPNNSLTMGDIPSYVNFNYNTKNTGLLNLNSVDLVFTPDQSKWSRCIVLEMGESPGLNEGGAAKFSLRAHASWNGKINAQGNPVYDSSTTGMSYFPGYAVNLETGDRLNVFFSEDSHLPQENGADMLWNPTSDMYNYNSGFLDYIGRYLWGGKHWIYVMNNSSPSTNAYQARYDSCKTYYNLMTSNPTQKSLGAMWSACIWVGEPLLATNAHLASLKDGLIPSVTTIRLRVSKPYNTFSTSATPVNNNLPYYTFSTNNIAPVRNTSVGKNAMSEVGISPNPYYAGSLYETKSTDNRVRFVNIPSKCEIKIYTLDGVLVRTYTQDQTKNMAYQSNGTYPATYLDWDLTNQKGVPVASGVYLIHVNGYELGETVLKWFGVMKPLELNTF